MDILLIIITDKKRIFQGDFLSPLPHVSYKRHLLDSNSTKKRKKLIVYQFNASDVKIYGRGEGENDSLVQTARTFSNDVGVDFGINKCAVLVMTEER